MSSRNAARSIFGALALTGALAACGFEPIAAPTISTTSEARLPLRAIDIVVSADADVERFEYMLRQALGRSVAVDETAREGLSLAVVVDREGLAIEQNDTVTRFNLTATTDYAVGATGQSPSLSGQTVSITALNATASQFTTRVSERAAMERLAEDIANRVVTLLRLRSASSSL